VSASGDEPTESGSAQAVSDDRAVTTPEPVSDAPRSRSVAQALHGWLPWVLPIMAWGGISAYLYGNFLARPNAGVPGGPDGVIYVWFFKFVETAITHLHNPLLSSAMNAPTGVSLMWNTSAPLLAVGLAPLTATIGPVATVGIAMVASPVLSACAAYFAFRRITGRIAASLIAATFYAFSPFFVAQNGHLHLIAAGPLLPLILLVGYRLFVTQDASPVWLGVWLGLLGAALLFVAEEVEVMVAIAAMIAVVLLAALYYSQLRAKVRYAATGVAVGAGVTAVIVAYPLYYQLFGPLAIHGALIRHKAASDLASFVRPPWFLHFSTAADRLANRSFYTGGVENTAYLGVPVLLVVAALLIWLAFRRRSRVPVWWLLTAGAVAGLSLGSTVWLNGHRTGIHGPWWLFDHGPLKSVVVPRFSLLTALLIAFLIAWGLATISGRAYAAAAVAVSVALISLLPAGRYIGLSKISTPKFFTTAAVKRIPPGATVLLLPNSSGPGPSARVMYWQAKAGMRFRIVGGYGVFNKNGGWSYFGELPQFASLLNTVGETGVRPTELALLAARASLVSSPVSDIVITPLVRRPGLTAAVAEELTGCTVEKVADVGLCAVPRG
jgi:hypothetical protein